MKKQMMWAAAIVSCLTIIVIVVGSVVIVAQTTITGTWTADTRSEKKESDGKIHISFERKTAHGTNQNGQSYAYDELKGLSREQAQNGRVRFSLVREAGTIECEGAFADGRGSGTFTFTPNRGFIDAMRSRGFDFEKSDSKHGSGDIDDSLFAAVTLNITTALADDLKSADFGPLEVDDLFKAAIFKVDGKFMAEMKASGFPNLKMEDLVKARIFKIDPDYVRQVHEMGFDNRDFEGLVKFRIFKVTPEYLNELKAAGLNELKDEDVVKCRIFNIDPEFIKKAKAENPNVTVEELVQMKIGVHPRVRID
jgi:hypothetical protein